MKNLKNKVLSTLGTDKFDDVMNELEHDFQKRKRHTEDIVEDIIESDMWTDEQRIELRDKIKTQRNKKQ